MSLVEDKFVAATTGAGLGDVDSIILRANPSCDSGSNGRFSEAINTQPFTKRKLKFGRQNTDCGRYQFPVNMRKRTTSLASHFSRANHEITDIFEAKFF
jgi:hypothetical protein